jgi:hypothetical protein
MVFCITSYPFVKFLKLDLFSNRKYCINTMIPSMINTSLYRKVSVFRDIASAYYNYISIILLLNLELFQRQVCT